MIECKQCNTHKATTEYYVKDRGTGRKDTTCKSCRIIKYREQRLGVTQSDYLDMMKRQKSKCGICERRLYSKRYKAFCVDHDHDTGKVRGLLCHNCNRALGMFQDCKQNLSKAIKYLEGIVRHS